MCFSCGKLPESSISEFLAQLLRVRAARFSPIIDLVTSKFVVAMLSITVENQLSQQLNETLPLPRL